MTDSFDKSSTPRVNYGPVKCVDVKLITFIDASDGVMTKASDYYNGQRQTPSMMNHVFIFTSDGEKQVSTLMKWGCAM
jgi:hypothetical protein